MPGVPPGGIASIFSPHGVAAAPPARPAPPAAAPPPAPRPAPPAAPAPRPAPPAAAPPPAPVPRAAGAARWMTPTAQVSVPMATTGMGRSTPGGALSGLTPSLVL